MTIILIILAVILAIALLSIAIGEFFLRFALSTSYDNSNKLTDDSVSEQYFAEEEENRRFLEEKCSDVYIKSADTMNLHAYLFSSSSHKYLITVHGYKGGATNNGILYRKDGTKRIADNTLVAITLMIAESRTEEKDVMVSVVVNLINKSN